MKTIRAFLVEDSAMLRRDLVCALEEMAPVRVIGVAADEFSACARLSGPGGDCELVIIDLFLTRGSGFDVLQHLRALGHPARRVVLSNWVNDNVRDHCERLGADVVFDKSSEIEELLLYCQGVADLQVCSRPAALTG